MVWSYFPGGLKVPATSRPNAPRWQWTELPVDTVRRVSAAAGHPPESARNCDSAATPTKRLRSIPARCHRTVIPRGDAPAFRRRPPPGPQPRAFAHGRRCCPRDVPQGLPGLWTPASARCQGLAHYHLHQRCAQRGTPTLEASGGTPRVRHSRRNGPRGSCLIDGDRTR